MQNHLTNHLLIPYNRFNIGFKDCEGKKDPQRSCSESRRMVRDGRACAVDACSRSRRLESCSRAVRMTTLPVYALLEAAEGGLCKQPLNQGGTASQSRP